MRLPAAPSTTLRCDDRKSRLAHTKLSRRFAIATSQTLPFIKHDADPDVRYLCVTTHIVQRAAYEYELRGHPLRSLRRGLVAS